MCLLFLGPGLLFLSTAPLWTAAACIALSIAGAVGLFRLSFARTTWTHGEVARDVGAGLRRLLIVTAVVSLASAHPAALPTAGAILLGYPLAHGLRRVFPPS